MDARHFWRGAARHVERAEALDVVELIEAEDEGRFDAAAVRWVGRFALETRDLMLAVLVQAVDALARRGGDRRGWLVFPRNRGFA